MKFKKVLTKRESDILNKYMTEAGNYPILSIEEEINLFKRIKKGDLNAKNKIIKSNLRFVISVAKQYQDRGLPLLDLIEEGNLGLIKAIDKFDVTKGFKFITYAVWWIRQSILQALADHSRTVRIPSNRMIDMYKYNKLKSSIWSDLGYSASLDEISRETGLSHTKIENLENLQKRDVSLDDTVYNSEKDNQQYYKDIITADPIVDIQQSLDLESKRKCIKRALSKLSEAERLIVEKSFGLNNYSPTSFRVLGEEFGLTGERIRQIRFQALLKVKEYLKNNIDMNDFYD